MERRTFSARSTPSTSKRLKSRGTPTSGKPAINANAFRGFIFNLRKDRNFYNKAFRTFYVGLDGTKRRAFLEGCREWFGQDEDITVSKVLRELAERNL